jgi:DNA-binding CsgD family transcriptional regulator
MQVPTRELLERDGELEALSALLARARDGDGGLLLIEAPAGAGKSRLLGSAREIAREADMQVLEARGALLEREFAFGVVRQLFEPAVMSLEGDGREAAFAGAAGLAARLLGEDGPGLVSQGGDASFGALHGLHWLTANLADRGPLLLSVDDAHWADPSSLQFLGYLSRRLDGLPVGLVAAGRPPDPSTAELWGALAGDPTTEILHPHPLTGNAVATVVRDGLGEDAHQDFCSACHRATGGNPLFVRELVGALAEAEVAPTRAAAESVTEVGPPAVARFVLHRLERLGPEATSLARAVAVLGGDADLELAAKAGGLDDRQARAAADRLAQADVLARDQRLGFVHPIVEAAIYEDLLPADRADRHLVAAELLEEAGAPPERVGRHLLLTRPSGAARWVATLREAAQSASERGAPGAAVAYLKRALEEPPGEAERGEILCDLGRWETARQDYTDADEHLRAAFAAARDSQTRNRAATWLSRMAITGKPEAADAGLAALREQQLDADPEIALEAEAEAVALTRITLSLRHLAGESLAAFVDHAIGHPRFEPIALCHVASERMVSGAPAKEIGPVAERALAEGPTDPFALGTAIEVLISSERHTAAARYLDRTLAAARAYGLAAQLAGLHSERARLRFALGDVGDADVDIQTALELADERHFMLHRMVATAVDVALERGDLEAAEALLDRKAEALSQERVTTDEHLASRARLRLAQGDPREALTDLLHAGELLHAYGNPHAGRDWRPDAALALAELGESERAEVLAREGIALARRYGAARPLAKALRAGGTAIGGEEGLLLLEDAVAVAESSACRLETAHAHAALGLELVARRKRREGRERLRRALDLAQRCGAPALADRVRGDLGAGGGRPARLEVSGVEALTPAERRVCDLATENMTNREIAQTLFVTEKTVELHLTSAYRKLGIRSRFQLASVMPEAVPS